MKIADLGILKDDKLVVTRRRRLEILMYEDAEVDQMGEVATKGRRFGDKSVLADCRPMLWPHIVYSPEFAGGLDPLLNGAFVRPAFLAILYIPCFAPHRLPYRHLTGIGNLAPPQE